ncbi:cobalamin-binding protein [Thiolapillus brandeum]|nr:cobalamin-binding protein [Thiolapillus brandeum]
MTVFLRALLLFSFLAPVWGDIRVEDDLGREVRLASSATRILTLAPHATEMLLAIGAEKRLVAVAQFSEYPHSLDKIPRIDTLGSLNREYLLETNPDLVIAWGSGNRQADLQWLRHSDIPVFISEPGTLDDIATTLEKLGRLIGEPKAGRKAAARFLRDLDQACPHRSSGMKVPTYYEIWATPPMTIGGRHWLNEVLERAGLHNVFAQVPRLVFTVNPESLMTKDIQVIVTSQPTAPRPVEGGHVFVANSELGRPGPRLVEGLKALCRQM